VKSILETERSKEKNHRQKTGASARHGLPSIGPVAAGSVIIRSYNEHAPAGELVRRVTAVNIPLEKELVILDGSSGDGTRELLETLEPSIRRHSPARVEPIFRAGNRENARSEVPGCAKTPENGS
jgi:Glycosyl transferase family 2